MKYTPLVGQRQKQCLLGKLLLLVGIILAVTVSLVIAGGSSNASMASTPAAWAGTLPVAHAQPAVMCPLITIIKLDKGSELPAPPCPPLPMIPLPPCPSNEITPSLACPPLEMIPNSPASAPEISLSHLLRHLKPAWYPYSRENILLVSSRNTSCVFYTFGRKPGF